MVSRRRVALSLSCACALHISRSVQAFPTSQKRTEIADASSAVGCGFDDENTATSGGKLAVSSGLADVDSRVVDAIPLLNTLYHSIPDFSFYYEDRSPQAKALRPTNGGTKTRVLLGVALCKRVRSDAKNWSSTVVGILAHEWAHVFQYRTSFQAQRYTWETHADFLSGWCMSRLSVADPDLRIDKFSGFLLSTKGNLTGYFNEELYGSPEQRSKAALAGFDFGHSTQLGKYGDEWDAAGAGYEYVRNTRA
jgi:hypothetical protein